MSAGTNSPRSAKARFLLSRSLLLFVFAFSFSLAGCQPSASKTDDPVAQPAERANGTTTFVEPTKPVSTDVALHPGLKDRRYDAPIRDVVVREDPVVDGWDTEQFNEVASKQLKLLGQAFQRGHAETKSTNLCTENFVCGPIRPTGSLKRVYEGPLFAVYRANAPPSLNQPKHRGPQGLDEAIKEQASLFPNATDSHFKFKIIRVAMQNGQASTKAYFQMTAKQSNGRAAQANATWECEWTVDKIPLLRSIRVTDYEEVISIPNATRSKTAFSDCTESQFEGNELFEKQLIHGRDHWYGSLESTIGVEGRGNGIAIGDANGDGIEDIYLCQPAALPNRLLIRSVDGRFEDRSAAAGVDWLDSSRGALFVDMDNDGDQDLILAESTSLILHENDGTGDFSVRGRLRSDSRLFSINAVDYDNDGDLDLFASGYSGIGQIRPDDIFASPVPYHDANNGAPNILWRNDGEWDFADVTADVGLDKNNLRFSLASVWDDMDNDGDLDLYIANDFGRNNLFRNDKSTDGKSRKFVDIAGSAGVEDIGPGMSAAWGDANNDGLMDLYVSNMFSSAGNRITNQQQFKPGAAAEDIAGFKRHARGNSLFLNQGDGTFTDRAVQSATVMGRWAWGSLFADLNNDGHRDVYVTNGFVTADNNNDL